MRVCVIGAGFAGLSAAERFPRGGGDVIFVEAPRGRRACLVGASGRRRPRRARRRVHHRRIRADRGSTAARLRIELDGMGINYPDRELRPGPGPDAGTLLRGAEAAAAASARPASAPPPASPSPAPSSIRGPRGARAAAAERPRPSVRCLDGDVSTKVDLPDRAVETRRVRGGNQRLATALAARLPRRADPGSRSGRSPAKADGVRAARRRPRICRGSMRGRGALFAVGEIGFEPGLPEAVESELNSIPMSSAAKLAVELRRPESPRAVMSVPGRFWAWTTPCDQVGGRVVGSWAGAQPVLDDLSVRSRPGSLARSAAGALARAGDGRRVGAAHRLGRRLLVQGRLLGPPQLRAGTAYGGIAPRGFRRRAHGGRVVGNDGGRVAERPPSGERRPGPGELRR